MRNPELSSDVNVMENLYIIVGEKHRFSTQFIGVGAID